MSSRTNPPGIDVDAPRSDYDAAIDAEWLERYGDDA